MATKRDDILGLLEDPKVKPSLITMLVVGALLGYAIKIAVDSFRKNSTT
jgi:hypothetical protein